jgi:hypothetical protein
MTNYTVIHAFTDKTNGAQYEIGQTYEAQSEQRAKELEQGGYIVEANSQQAQSAQMEQKAAQANAKGLAQAHQEAAKAIEPKTVVNGKVVSLKAAQAAEAYFEANNTQTGIQAHHENTTEAVPAGQIAQQGQQAMNQQQMNQATGAAVRQANVQSSQAHLEESLSRSTSTAEAGRAQMYNQGENEFTKSLQSAQTTNAQGTAQQSQQQSQQLSQQQQQAAQAAAMRAEQTNPAAAEAEEAALNSKAAAKARAKKENQ